MTSIVIFAIYVYDLKVWFKIILIFKLFEILY